MSIVEAAAKSPIEKVALVTGGSRGLGQACVAGLLEDGFRVATFSRSRTSFIDECESAHAEAFYWSRVDSASPDEVRDFARSVTRRFGRVDVLINNAAVVHETVLPLLAPEQVRAMLAVNFESIVYLTQAVTRAMLRQRGGVILNISSIVGRGGYTGLTVYGSTKAAIEGFTRGLARELGPKGIRANAIAPGYLATEMTANLAPKQLDQILRRTPLRRLGHPDDLVGLIRFLASPAASFITGQTFVVDGGLTC